MGVLPDADVRGVEYETGVEKEMGVEWEVGVVGSQKSPSHTTGVEAVVEGVTGDVKITVDDLVVFK